MNESYDKSLLWKRKTGKARHFEFWNDDVIHCTGAATKDEDRYISLKKIHPLYHTKSVTENWITEDLARQFQGGEVARPSWLGQAFKDRMVVIFKFWKDEAAEGRVREALEQLVPTARG